jgi:hypothetical protein
MSDTYEIELTIAISKPSEQRTLSRNILTFYGLDPGDMKSLEAVIPQHLAVIWSALQKAANSPTKVT